MLMEQARQAPGDWPGHERMPLIQVALTGVNLQPKSRWPWRRSPAPCQCRGAQNSMPFAEVAATLYPVFSKV